MKKLLMCKEMNMACWGRELKTLKSAFDDEKS